MKRKENRRLRFKRVREMFDLNAFGCHQHTDHVESRLISFNFNLLQIPLGRSDDLPLLAWANRLGRHSEQLTAACLDFNEKQIFLVPGDDIDFPERGPEVAFNNFRAFFPEIPGGFILAPGTQFQSLLSHRQARAP